MKVNKILETEIDQLVYQLYNLTDEENKDCRGLLDLAKAEKMGYLFIPLAEANGNGFLLFDYWLKEQHNSLPSALADGLK